MANQIYQSAQVSRAYTDNRSITNSTSYTNQSSTTNNTLVVSPTFEVTNISYTVTDHGAIKEAAETSRKALQSMENVSTAALKSAENSTKNVLTANFNAQLLTAHQQITNQIILFQAIAKLPPDALAQVCQNSICHLTHSLTIVDNTIKSRLEHSRIEQIDSANAKLYLISAQLGNEATKIFEEHKKRFWAFAIPAISLLYLPSLFVTLPIACIYVTSCSNNEVKQDEIKQKQELIKTYQSILDMLKKDPELTIRNAVGQTTKNDTILQKFSNTPVIGSLDKANDKTPYGLQCFLDCAREFVPLPKQ